MIHDFRFSIFVLAAATAAVVSAPALAGGSTLMCPNPVHVVIDSTSAPPPAGWSAYLGGFYMPLVSAAIQPNPSNAAQDLLRCNYGGPAQYAIVKYVAKGSCVMSTVTPTGFVCK